MLAKVLREEMNFTPTEADPDVFIRKASKANGELYYEMLLVYVDDILAVSEIAEELVGILGKKFKLKKSSVGRPTRYLGGGVERIQTDDGRIIWSTNCTEYIKAALHQILSLCIKGVMASVLFLQHTDLSLILVQSLKIFLSTSSTLAY